MRRHGDYSHAKRAPDSPILSLRRAPGRHV